MRRVPGWSGCRAKGAAVCGSSVTELRYRVREESEHMKAKRANLGKRQEDATYLYSHSYHLVSPSNGDTGMCWRQYIYQNTKSRTVTIPRVD